MKNEWIEMPFTEAVTVNPNVRLKKGEQYPFVDMKSVDPSWRSAFQSEKRIFQSGGAKFLPNDTLMARITPCLENGKIARYVNNENNGPAFGSTEFIVIRGKKNVSDNDFVYYLSRWEEFRAFAVSQMAGTSGRQRVPADSLAGFKVKLPPLPEQRAIAHILGSLDDKIELNRKMNETLEAMAQAMFKSWFADFDPVIDKALAAGNEIPEELQEKAAVRESLGNARKSLPEEISRLFPNEFEHTEEMGWIPKGWKVSSVGKEFDVTMGQSPPSSAYNETGEGLPFFQGRADYGFRYPSNRVYCTQPKRFASKNDTLVSVRAPVGDVNMASDTCCIGRGLSAIRHKSGSRSYTYYAMLQLRENFNKFEAEGTVFGSINQKDFKELKWIKCDSALIEKYEFMAGGFDEKIEKCSQNNIVLSTLRDTLLPKLLSGQLRIPEAEKLAEAAL